MPASKSASQSVWCDLPTACTILDVDKSVVFRLVKAGKIRKRNLPALNCYDRAQLEKLAHETSPPASATG